MVKMAIFIKGGIIQSIISDEDVDIRLIDQDTEGLEDDEITEVNGIQSHVTDHESEIETDRVEEIFAIVPTQQIAE